MKYRAQIGDREYRVETSRGDGKIRIEKNSYGVDFRPVGDPSNFSLIVNHRSYQVRIHPDGPGYRVEVGGNRFLVNLEDERQRLFKEFGRSKEGPSVHHEIRAPMPGMVVKVEVGPGDPVSTGQGVMVVEAMKMENEIRTPMAGTVEAVRVKVGQSVKKNEVLMVLGAPP
ncbi:acetyl-CoA carboxylase biotin carboxyl carrier protein subunit [candidate division KSB1 bacterium]|nr:acetyl-CoA carboxylase biotin carboxyl carrier protein subunit [candidate division KSB1 bacterium]